MLTRYWIKVKRFWEKWRADIILGATAFFISIASFSLGYLTAKRSNPPQIVISGASGVSMEGAMSQPAVRSGAEAGTYVASRNGKYYYLPICPAASRIKEENKIWFDSREEAEARGYQPSSQCPGL